MIKGFKQLQYHFLSNMFPCKIVYKGMQFKCSESIYQGIKTDKLEDFKDLDGYSAKKKAKTLTARADWNDIKINVMKLVLQLKFTQNPLLKQWLLDTGDEYIEETNYWKDTFWGVCDGVGENNLGILLMKLRDHFKN